MADEKNGENEQPQEKKEALERRAASALTGSTPFEYAAAPESTEIVKIKERYGLFIGGDFVEPRSEKWFGTINPATEQSLTEVAEAGKEDVDLAVTEARQASERYWRDLPGRERAKYLYRIARQIQERSREFAVLESMDGGKPIKEARDVDLPLAAAHFFYYAGWADKLDYAFPARLPKPLGVAGQVIPWNFPLLMAAWKIAPALATGNTVVLKPAETTPLTALLLAEVIREAAHPGARRQGRQHRVRGRRPGPGRGGHRQWDLLQPGPRVLRRIAAVRPGVGVRAGPGEAEGSPGHAPGRRSSRQEHRRRSDQLEAAAPEDRGAGRVRRGGGRGDLPAGLRSPGSRLLVPSHPVHQRGPVASHRTGGDLRPRPLGPHVPDARGSSGEGEQHAVWALGRRVDREGLPDPVDDLPPSGRGDLGQHVQPVRSQLAVRRV